MSLESNMATKTNAKQGFKIKLQYTPHMPNEAHRVERWSGARVQKNLKKYTRKSKHRLPLDLSVIARGDTLS